MPTSAEIENEILAKISESLKDGKTATYIKDLAEAYAWVRRPSQSHGGTVVSS